MKFGLMKYSTRNNNISSSTRIKAQIIYKISGKKPRKYRGLRSSSKYAYNKSFDVFKTMKKIFNRI